MRDTPHIRSDSGQGHFSENGQIMIEHMEQNEKKPLYHRIRKNAGSRMVEGFFAGASRLGRLHPASRLEKHGVEVLKDIPYTASGLQEHLLDVYRPVNRTGPLPVCIYVHGGGFRILSKETHWLMGLAFARRGYVVFNINYRLAPENPFPCALVDTCDAFDWVAGNAESYGGDLNRLVLAGESAGANLITALTVALCYQRPEEYAQKPWFLDLVPKVVVPACGLFQVSDIERFNRRRDISWFVNDRLTEVSQAYLAGRKPLAPRERELADPLLILEQGRKPDRGLPAFFIPVGTRDPILDDTRRLETALQRLGADCAAEYYKGERHAFHAFVLRENARRCWRQTFDFLSPRV